MFTKVLVANRGEIAVRVIRACRELGLNTVAVYSEVDRNSMHVRQSDEAYLLGPPAAKDSYLRGDKIIEIAKKAGAGAIHPGYGFLAERDDFAEAVQEAGLVFIGPKPSAIAAMGDKAAARATVAAAGIPVIPGTDGDAILTDEDLIALAPDIGYPLVVKAYFKPDGAKPRPPSEMGTFIWRSCCLMRGTSNSRSWRIHTGTPFTWGSGNARSSAGTRSFWKRLPLPSWTILCANKWASWPAGWPRQWIM